MSDPRDQIRVHRGNSSLRILVEGRATMVHGLPLRRYVEDSLREHSQTIQVDLHQCEYMDSTFLGTLLYIKRLASRQHACLILIAPSEACDRLFEQLGLSDVFEVIPRQHDSVIATDDIGTQILELNYDDFETNVLEAHEELACQPGKSANIFGPVARCLAKEMEEKKK